MVDTTEYIEQRLVPQIEWYDDKAQQSKRRHHLMAGLGIVLASAIPVLVSMPFLVQRDVDRPIVAVIGGALAVLAGLRSLLRHQESWLQYRSVTEKLRKELNYALTESGPYADLDETRLRREIVVRVEDIVSGEHEAWLSTQRQVGDKETP